MPQLIEDGKPAENFGADRGRGRGKKPSVVDIAYRTLREMILNYDIKPGERLNEIELAKSLKISRPALREALNKITFERLLGFEASFGFFRPKINLKEITGLYEYRVILETVGLGLSLDRASDDEIEGLISFWSDAIKNVKEKSVPERIADDEAFHERLIALSHNDELVHALKYVNARIHFIRWADPGGNDDHQESYEQHLVLLRLLRAREKEESCAQLQKIIEKRSEDIADVLKEGAAKLFIS